MIPVVLYHWSNLNLLLLKDSQEERSYKRPAQRIFYLWWALRLPHLLSPSTLSNLYVRLLRPKKGLKNEGDSDPTRRRTFSVKKDSIADKAARYTSIGE